MARRPQAPPRLSPSRPAELDLKLGVNAPHEHPLTARLTEAARAMSQLRAGGIELLAAPSMTPSILVPLPGLPSVGFAFYDQVRAAMDRGAGEVVHETSAEAGLVPMRKLWDNGFRQITSSSSRQLNQHRRP